MVQRDLARGIAAALLLCLAAGPAPAHPHVFIDYSVTILCDSDRIAGVRLSWTFDEMYSASLFHDYTGRPSGPLSAHDIEELRTGAFIDTADYHFFTDVAIDGKPLDIKAVKDFDADYDRRFMTYRFTVPIDAAPRRGETLAIDAFDNEFYIDFELAKRDAIKIEHNDKLKLACAEKKETRNTAMLGPVDTRFVSCTVEKAA